MVYKWSDLLCLKRTQRTSGHYAHFTTPLCSRGMLQQPLQQRQVQKKRCYGDIKQSVVLRLFNTAEM